MTEAAGVTATATGASSTAPSAGELLRRAREARGLHVAALAASLKVPPKRLEALEQDRWDDLPDPAFTRALAQSVCRALKTDPVPVLALLPRADANRLEQVSGRINTPFRERPGSGEPGMAGLLSRPVVWVVAALLAAAGAVLLWPAGIAPDQLPAEPAGVASTESPLPLLGDAGDPEPAAESVDAVASPVAGAASAPQDAATTTAAAAPAGAGDAAAAPTAAATAAPLLEIRAAADSWVEVRDAAGRVLVSRTLKAGETVALDPALPARLTTGNVAGTEVLLRGQRVDMTPQQSGNIARFELR